MNQLQTTQDTKEMTQAALAEVLNVSQSRVYRTASEFIERGHIEATIVGEFLSDEIDTVTYNPIVLKSYSFGEHASMFLAARMCPDRLKDLVTEWQKMRDYIKTGAIQTASQNPMLAMLQGQLEQMIEVDAKQRVHDKRLDNHSELLVKLEAKLEHQIKELPFRPQSTVTFSEIKNKTDKSIKYGDVFSSSRIAGMIRESGEKNEITVMYVKNQHPKAEGRGYPVYYVRQVNRIIKTATENAKI
tara:strand:+ start:48 stop:779 length:732 start_codon:yes stop_codon:yes gene_type:complete